MFDYLDKMIDGDVDMEERIGVVVMRITVVQTALEIAAKMGLFGHLADACIQLVEVSDGPRLTAFFDFAEKCESEAKGLITKRQDFHRDSSESVKKSLEDKLAEAFGAQAAKELPPLGPAIMFRLCTHCCNHSVKPRDVRKR